MPKKTSKKQIAEMQISAYIILHEWGMRSCTNPILAFAFDHFLKPFGIGSEGLTYDINGAAEHMVIPYLISPSIDLTKIDPDKAVIHPELFEDIANTARFFSPTIDTAGYVKAECLLSKFDNIDTSFKILIQAQADNNLHRALSFKLIGQMRLFLGAIPTLLYLDPNPVALECLLSGNMSDFYNCVFALMEAFHQLAIEEQNNDAETAEMGPAEFSILANIAKRPTHQPRQNTASSQTVLGFE